MLHDRMRADLKVYREAVATLEAASAQSARKDFDKAVNRAEAARRAFQRARGRLNRHVVYHGCK